MTSAPNFINIIQIPTALYVKYANFVTALKVFCCIEWNSYVNFPGNYVYILLVNAELSTLMLELEAYPQ